MSLKCEYCPKSFDGLNRENINRHNNKHLNKKHQKITNIKPINSFLKHQVLVYMQLKELSNLVFVIMANGLLLSLQRKFQNELPVPIGRLLAKFA